MGIPIRSRVLRSELEGPARQSVSKVPSLEKMSEDFVPSVVSLSVGPLKPLHPIHQVALRSFNQQMVMIVHQHVSMNAPPGLLAGFFERVEKAFPVGVVFVDGSALIASRHDMVGGTGILDAQ